MQVGNSYMLLLVEGLEHALHIGVESIAEYEYYIASDTIGGITTVCYRPIDSQEWQHAVATWTIWTTTNVENDFMDIYSHS